MKLEDRPDFILDCTIFTLSHSHSSFCFIPNKKSLFIPLETTKQIPKNTPSQNISSKSNFLPFHLDR